MINEYSTILHQFFFKECALLFIFAFICICFVIDQLRKGAKKETAGGIFILVLIAGLLVYNVATIELDIKNNSVVQMEYSEGTHHPDGHPQLLVKNYWFKGEDRTEELSVVTDLPMEMHNGTITYSKRSKVLLDYTAESENDW